MLPGSGQAPSPVPVPSNPPSLKFLPCGLLPLLLLSEVEPSFETETSVDLNFEAGLELNSPPERIDSAARDESSTLPVDSCVSGAEEPAGVNFFEPAKKKKKSLVKILLIS